MKVLYFHQHFSTPSGAAGTRSYEMAKRLISHGHHVTMVCGSYSGGETGLKNDFIKGVRKGVVDGIHVVEFKLNYSNQDGFMTRTLLFLSFAVKSIQVAMFENYDLLFATTTPLTAAIPGIFAKLIRRKPFVFEVRDLWPELPKAMGVIKNPIVLGLMSFLEWTAYKSADRLIALSPGIKQGILRIIKDESRVILIPNGCDIDFFDKKSAAPWRPASINDSDFLAIFTGTHGLANGLGALIKVAEILQKHQRYDIKILLVGQGKEKAQLQQLATNKGLENIVFHDPVSKHQLTGLTKSANLGLQILANVPAFYYGTSPNKFFDYLSSGLPVLCNYPGWIADLITNVKCGVAVDADDPEAFVLAIENLADNSEQLKPMSLAAKELAVSQFNREILAEQFVLWLETSWEKSC
ncbi:MAG: glycosyltransferase WbuB [Gammaproteobacteria bacterium CG22_combo_CG10-13_8_21_14_all_40_8]|nr:MAG: glycosyltransferase WbuB [Gammaproteobacteria bacterium CG22_combo_CG10-13_8_21_14_all_40_8]